MKNMDTNIIQIENLSKLYRLGQVGTGTLSHDLNRWFYRIRGKEDPYIKIGVENDRESKTADQFVWALSNININITEGEVVGLIGRNGAGKSTLLKVLSKITSPTSGEIRIKGRVASLLEVGTGFHPELTGRENVYLNGAILGMSKLEVKSKFDEIVEFAGVAKYIDTPVKRYSSGMLVRLGFAVAAHLEPEILIVDEVLAVGDMEFQHKCLGKMKDVSGTGRTIIFVSHNMASIQSLTKRCILFDKGQVKLDSRTEDAIFEYNKLNSFSEENTSITNLKSKTTDFEIINFSVKKNESNGFNVPINFQLKIRVGNNIATPVLTIMIYNSVGARIITAKNFFENIEKGEQTFNLIVENHHLTPGNYSVKFTFSKSRDIFIDEKDGFTFEISDANIDLPLLIPHLDKGRDKIGAYHEFKIIRLE